MWTKSVLLITAYIPLAETNDFGKEKSFLFWHKPSEICYYTPV